MKTQLARNLILTAAALGLTAALGATRPVAHWTFDDASALGKDAIGDNDLVAAIATDDGTPKSVADGHLGAAVNMSRTASVIGNAMRGKQGALPTGNAPFTVTAWIRPDTSGCVNTAYLILHTPVTGGKPDAWSGNSWAGWHIRFAAQGKLVAVFSDTKGGWIDPNSTNPGIITLAVANNAHCDGKWHLVTLSRDENNLVSLSWDGVKTTKTIACFVTEKAALRIGSYSTGNGFSGDYDEIKAYDSVLSDVEIKLEYDARVTDLTVSGAADESLSRHVYGATAGEGTLTFGGASYQNLLAPLAFAGTYRLYSAIVDFGSSWQPRAPGAEAKFDLACGGAFNLFADQTVAGLSGEGVLGRVNLAAGTTLTVNAADDAAFAGTLAGDGALVKAGAGTLTLNGDAAVTNVTVSAGTLAIGNPLSYHNASICSWWTFEDGANLGRDRCANSDFSVIEMEGSSAEQRADGKYGSCAALRKGTSLANVLVTPKNAVPTGAKPMTVAAWIRPNADSPASAYVLVNRTVGGGKPGAWTDAAWDGWHVRFWGGNKLAAGGYSTGAWTNPTDNPGVFAVGTLPNATCYKDGQWHQIAVTYDDATEVTALYFDGKAIASLTKARTLKGGERLSIGAQDPSNSFSGDYDEVQVFAKALSADEIAANYVTTRPPAETRLVDEATARWTFDELVTEGKKQLFKETGAAGLGCDLLNTTNGAGAGVLCVTGDGANGGAAYVRDAGSYLQLDDGSKAGTNLVQYGWPTFTVSIRIKNIAYTDLSRHPAFCFGNATTAQGCLRLSYEGQDGYVAPQGVRILAGNSYTNGTSGVMLTDTTSSPSEKSPWVTFTFVNDQETKKLRVYRDGRYIQTISTDGQYMGSNQTAFSFDLSRLDIGYNTYVYSSGFLVDDLCVFRKRVLSDADVARLVREQAGETVDPLNNARVAVNDGATFAVAGRDVALASLTGVGTVEVASSATLAAQDWSGFDGAFTGAGALVVSGWGPKTKVPRVLIAPTGTVAFATEPEPGRYTIAQADAFETPADFSGWSATGVGNRRVTFRVKNDAFQVVVKGGLFVIVK